MCEDTLRKWYWHESDALKGDLLQEQCDWEKKKLKAAFEGVGLNAKQSAAPANGDNTCYRIVHVDEVLEGDEEDPKEIAEQKYTVDGKEYTVSIQRPFHKHFY